MQVYTGRHTADTSVVESYRPASHFLPYTVCTVKKFSTL